MSGFLGFGLYIFEISWYLQAAVPGAGVNSSMLQRPYRRMLWLSSLLLKTRYKDRVFVADS
jgi:hypothetical protein